MSATRVLPLAVLAVLSLPAVAGAQEATPTAGSAGGGVSATGLGVGVHALLSGPFGPAIVYGATNFHLEGIFGFADQGPETTIVAGGRFWWHVHQAAAADLSLGGGGGLVVIERDGMGGDENDLFLEAGAQIRFFVVSNVALSAALGVTIAAGDADGFAVTGQLTGGLGLSYFFH